MHTLSPDEQDAKTALAEHAAELSGLSEKGVGHPDFINWKTATQKTFERYLPESVFSPRFAQICFDKPPLASSSDICMGSDFMEGLAIARTCLEEAIEYIELFGLKDSRTKIRASAYRPKEILSVGCRHLSGQPFDSPETR